MRRRVIAVESCVAVLCLAVALGAKDEKKEKPPMTGTWDCTSHSESNGDNTFTLYLEQEGEKITGSVDSPLGSAEITSGTFKNNTLEIHIDTGDANALLTAKFQDGKLSGDWSYGDMKGTWEGKLQNQTKSEN